MSVEAIYLDSAIQRLLNGKELAEKTFGQLDDKDFHFQPNGESNSIAVIIQHMSGNMLSRWTHFLEEDGEKPWRKRDDEFEEHPYSKLELIAAWDAGWTCMLNTLQSLTEKDLLATVHIRNEALSAIDAINRQLAHNSYHIGQIVYLGKVIRNTDWVNLSVPRRRKAG